MKSMLVAVATGALWLLACVGTNAQTPQLANPASQNCARQGGTLQVERRGDGGQYGVCVFTDNYQCEEWALLRGECPKSGLRVTGYATPAGRYCAITGGRYTVVGESSRSEQGVCSLPGGKTCNAAGYFAGTCSR